MKCTAIIVAAGSGRRMGMEKNKILMPIGGSPVIGLTLSAFLAEPRIDAIILVIRRQDESEIEQILSNLKGAERITVVYGGAERTDSVAAAVAALKRDVGCVLIHDGARPLIKRSTITAVLDALRSHAAVIPTVPVSNTIKVVADGVVQKTLQRSQLNAVQTPQGFERDLFERMLAFSEQSQASFTDDAAIAEALGETVYCVAGDVGNIKITNAQDLLVAETLLMNSRGGVMKVGTGYDVHRLVEGRKLIIGGVDIPFEKGLEGHSDADVLLHAITDAVLGAAGLGDIGLHFPDSDDRYHNIDSLLLLERAMQSVAEKGYKVNNIDATVVCQRPKLRPHIAQMSANIARALNVDVNCVNVKATTTEGLGFEGEGLGISAQAVASLTRF